MQQRFIEARRLLVEQTANIGCRHCRCIFAHAQSRQLQPRAMVIVGVGIPRRQPRGDGPCAVAQTVTDGAESKPCRGKSRRDLNRLRQDFRGARKVAPRGALKRRPVVLIGRHVAGRDEERSTCHCAI